MSHFEQFYVHPQDVFGEAFSLVDSEYNHAVRVMRKQVGDWLTAVDGQGHRYAGPITVINKQMLQVAIRTHEVECGEPRLKLVLAQAIPKGGAFDWIVEKGTEIGIAAFQPMQTERSVALPRGRQERWREKARAAMKQCGRSRCPVIHPIRTWQEVLSFFTGQSIFMAHPTGPAEVELRSRMLGRASQAVVLIGPEGGFTDGELETARARGVHHLSLGARRLRGETAGLVAAVRLLAEAGELDQDSQ